MTNAPLNTRPARRAPPGAAARARRAGTPAAAARATARAAALAGAVAAACIASAAHDARASGAAPAAPKAPPPLVAEPLGAGMWRIAGDAAGGVLVVEGADGLLLVDTHDPKRARDFDAALARVSRRPVRTVVVTHYHEDHVGGNARFRARGAAVIAHAAVPAQMAKDTVIADWGNWRREAAPREAFPTITFRDSLTLDLGAERVHVFHAPAAHSDGDLMLWFPARDLIHAADVIEVGAAPFVDVWAGGTLAGLIAAVDRVLAMSGPATRIVPGHGRIVDRAWVEEYRAMLDRLHGTARTAVAAGMSLADYVASDPLAPWHDRLGGPEQARQAAALAWFELNGMKR
uniref:MBL fold metallo-hydrolase n=1 Tax=Eiseniibacteriota bacterium TaxID=2212470 RepID=A0A832I4V3_UNCEI